MKILYYVVALVSIGLFACGSTSGEDPGPGGTVDAGPGGGGDGGGVCGDGQRDVFEACDGEDLVGASCQSLGYTLGELSCRADCTFDSSGCSGKPEDADLDGASGCEGIFSPEQVLAYQVEASNLEVDGPGRFRCGDELTLDVEVERKRGGGFKIDFNEYLDGQTYFGIKKLVYDTGGTTSVTDIVRQYLAWRMMHRAGVIASRAALAEVYVNDSYFGLLVNIEAVDKRLLKNRFGNDDGWLYKKSGGEGDGLKTHESDGLGDANPYDDYLCFWKSGNACPVPDDVATALPEHLAVEQFLRMGVVNALIANTDAPLFKDNNYYFYDWFGGRHYLPWDLDTVMKDDDFAMVQETAFAEALMPHFGDQYQAIAVELLAGPLALAEIHAEIDRVGEVAGAAIANAGGDPDAIVSELKTWWSERHALVSAQF